ncbi:MAG: DUF2520 domain-containing protein [Planctomycetota bacterium]
MAIRIAIVGPGRVGQAFARRWHEAGAEFLGFLGRDRERTQAALEFVGHGRALATADLADAHVLVLAVSDLALRSVAVELAAASDLRSCGLALHCSGSRGRDDLAPLAQRGLRTAALHPLAPFPDPTRGYAAMVGRHALCEAGPRAIRLTGRLATMAGLEPVFVDGPIDRTRYHLACALSANGVTALLAQAGRQMARALAVEESLATRLCADLLTSAVTLCVEVSPLQALSGPVVRGDVDLVARHLALLEGSAAADEPAATTTTTPRALDSQTVDARTAAAYRALMLEALALAEARGLSSEFASSLQSLLATASGTVPHDGSGGTEGPSRG